jgi:hypothetical protein
MKSRRPVNSDVQRRNLMIEAVAMITTIATALNVVDKFVSISDRLMKRTPKGFSVEAKQVAVIKWLRHVEIEGSPKK